MRKFLISLTAFLAGVIVAGTTLIGGQPAAPAPYCPAEDSCAIDYRDGAWHITEVQP